MPGIRFAEGLECVGVWRGLARLSTERVALVLIRATARDALDEAAGKIAFGNRVLKSRGDVSVALTGVAIQTPGHGGVHEILSLAELSCEESSMRSGIA